MVFFYPFELEIKDSTDTASQIHTLNYTLKLTARTKRCEKRDDFDFLNGTQDTGRRQTKGKNTTQYVVDTTMLKETHK